MDDLTPRPFFIIGHPRSGTTLLRFMISSHPRLYVPDETGFLPFLDTDPRAELDQTAVTALLHRIGQLNRFWDDLVADKAAFYAALSPKTLPIILDALYRLQTPPQTVRWGDKTPLYIQYIPQILAIFPRAQFIHVIRDGRDAALSARAKWGRSKPYMDLSYLLRNWVRNVQTGQTAGELLGPRQYYELRYETLIVNPAGTLQALCAYLGEPYDPAMLDYQTLAHQEGGGVDVHVEVQEELHSGSIGRWQREMTLFERKMAHTLAGSLLAELGYDSDDDLPPLTTTDGLHLAWLSARFHALDALRTWLYRRGTLTLNTNRRQRR
ncbi:MAG: sulfotransferase family protein [Candidatus Promineifilaceae bacterium]